ncbi:unnamed protein product [Eruca vesicaria subsp. sativa]|uniref:Uncharacterized protein n=1 Tax=Eruca vesicaria subsp. sativa TaxID=29727 RepID=A0ABC8J6W8_ERUVS|nr:unnamed protein product [Eruca vesicaria subsp. sativa]
MVRFRQANREEPKPLYPPLYFSRNPLFICFCKTTFCVREPFPVALSDSGLQRYWKDQNISNPQIISVSLEVAVFTFLDVSVKRNASKYNRAQTELPSSTKVYCCFMHNISVGNGIVKKEEIVMDEGKKMKKNVKELKNKTADEALNDV